MIDIAPLAGENELSVAARLERLTPPEWARLLSAGDSLCRGDVIDGEDLLQEALARYLSGERAWRSDLDGFQQVYSTMRSVLSSWRNQRKRRPETSFDEAMEATPELEGSEPGPMDDASEARGARIIASIEDHFAQDEEAKLMLSMMMDGYTRAEICELSEWSTTAYATIKKRIQRHLNRLRQAGEVS